MSTRLTIHHIGSGGDGVARIDGQPAYVPFTLPGETVNAAMSGERGEAVAIVEPSADRTEPVCRHFGTCGGCALQHWDAEAYRAWKRDRVVAALRSRGIEHPVDALEPCALQSRRRVVLSCRTTEAGPLLGFHAALSGRIVAIEECPITVPVIVDAFPVLRELIDIVGRGQGEFAATVTATETGLDVALAGLKSVEDGVRRAAAAFALERRFARLSHEGEIWIEPRPPELTFGRTKVVMPPGGFVQAVGHAERTMRELVARHLRFAKIVADLFAGMGTFALPLAERSKVHAAELDGASIAAMERAHRHGERLKPLTTERRDLFERPLTWKELKPFDAVVFDPPRAGAEGQCRQLSKSEVPAVAAVSCNPVSLARDLEILIDGGYELQSVTPIDQFLFSPHVEAVALLRRPKRRR